MTRTDAIQTFQEALALPGITEQQRRRWTACIARLRATQIAAATGSTEQQIRDAYHRLAPAAGDLVGLTDLRAALPHVPRAEMDAALRRLNRTRGVAVVPEANQKILDAAARAAAVVIGDQPKHAIAIS